jgi:acetyl-CoA acyltransferase
MNNVFVLGYGSTPFGNFKHLSLKELGSQAVKAALEDAGLPKEDIQTAVVGNCAGGMIVNQHNLVGQIVLHSMGIGSIPIWNVENACATGGFAFHLGWLSVASGQVDCCLVLGVEKLLHDDKKRTLMALKSGMDTEVTPGEQPLKDESKASPWVELNAKRAMGYLEEAGLEIETLAHVSVKNRYHASLNSNAYFQKLITVDDVLNSRSIVSPLTMLMCCPNCDGAAAMVLVSEKIAKKLSGNRPLVKVLAASTATACAVDAGEDSKAYRTVVDKAFSQSGLRASDIDLVMVHEPTASSELIHLETLGLVPRGEAGKMLINGDLAIGGQLPTNTDGGSLSRGHPIAATGIAQIGELVVQLRKEAGPRQVENARFGLAAIAGGHIGHDTAAATVHVLTNQL